MIKKSINLDKEEIDINFAASTSVYIQNEENDLIKSELEKAVK